MPKHPEFPGPWGDLEASRSSQPGQQSQKQKAPAALNAVLIAGLAIVAVTTYVNGKQNSADNNPVPSDAIPNAATNAVATSPEADPNAATDTTAVSPNASDGEPDVAPMANGAASGNYGDSSVTTEQATVDDYQKISDVLGTRAKAAADVGDCEMKSVTAFPVTYHSELTQADAATNLKLENVFVKLDHGKPIAITYQFTATSGEFTGRATDSTQEACLGYYLNSPTFALAVHPLLRDAQRTAEAAKP
ncbi:MAG TPA: hypothetical protein VFR09_04310, partial [Alphaproteobacteria bacterium]|nr:hypothetical protein [Alphaproteobacteria bacterium]